MGQIIGITGVIGAGKTTVAHIMQSLGAYVINADIVARYALLPESPLTVKVREEFGDEVMIRGCVVNRKKLAEVVFNDKQALERLNEITFPYIKQEMQREADIAMRIYKHDIVVFDAPLLIEAGLCEGLSDIWFVTASNDVKLKRIQKRDKTDEASAQKRINSRNSEDNLREKATVIIENNGSYDELRNKVEAVYKERYQGKANET